MFDIIFFLRNHLNQTYGLCSDLILHPLEYFQRFYVKEPKNNPVLTTLLFQIGGDSGIVVWKNSILCSTNSHNSVGLLESIEELGSFNYVLTSHAYCICQTVTECFILFSRSLQYCLTSEDGVDLLERTDVHIHFPAGAVGKDGPSAGVTIVTVLVSLFR